MQPAEPVDILAGWARAPVARGSQRGMLQEFDRNAGV